VAIRTFSETIVVVSARNRKRACAYCGEEKKLTRDHVPPRVFFSKPCPDRMLVVPACFGCNQGYKADDEYTRIALALDVRAASHRDVIGSLSALLRSLQYPEGRKFSQYLGRQMSPAAIFGGSGAPIGRMTQDRRRLNATGEHIVTSFAVFTISREAGRYEKMQRFESSIRPGSMQNTPTCAPLPRYFVYFPSIAMMQLEERSAMRQLSSMTGRCG